MNHADKQNVKNNLGVRANPVSQLQLAAYVLRLKMPDLLNMAPDTALLCVVFCRLSCAKR
jgi:hypothetical protein